MVVKEGLKCAIGLTGGKLIVQRVGRINVACAHLGHNAVATKRHIDFGISAFMGHDQPAVAKIISGGHDLRRHVPECGRSRQCARQRINGGCIVPASNDDHIGPKPFHCRHGDLLNRINKAFVTGQEIDREIEIIAKRPQKREMAQV